MIRPAMVTVAKPNQDSRGLKAMGSIPISDAWIARRVAIDRLEQFTENEE